MPEQNRPLQLSSPHVNQPDVLLRVLSISAAVLTISLGLCGLNFAVVSASRGNVSDFFIVAYYLEVGSIVLSAAVLIVSAILLLIRTARRRFHKTEDLA